MNALTKIRVLVALVGILLSVVVFSNVQAESVRSIDVDPIQDNTPGAGCTLREAIDVANAGLGSGPAPNGCTVTEAGSGLPVSYNIHLPSYTYTFNGTGTEDGNASGDLDLLGNINLIGANPSSTILDGAGGDRVIDIPINGISVSISNVTLRNGRQYGGVRNNGSTLSIANSTVTGNASAAVGGGIFVVGGVTTVTESIISDNEARNAGGAIGFDWQVGGTLTISDSVVTRNMAGGGGGVALSQKAILNVASSVISQNGAGGGGGILKLAGVDSFVNIVGSSVVENHATAPSSGRGGGILYGGPRSRLNIANSTIAGNTAELSGGGLYFTSGCSDYICGDTEANLTNVSLVNNSAAEGGGIFPEDGTLKLKNTLIADNQDSSGAGPDCLGTLLSLGHNLLGKNTGCLGSFPPGQPNANGDYVGTVGLPLYPKLGTPRSDPVVFPLQIDSPAIDKIPSSDCTYSSSGTNPLFDNAASVATDQTGNLRDSACDIGAYEVPALDIQVLAGGIDLPDDIGRVDFGVTSLDTPITKQFTVLNLGKSTSLVVSELTPSPGFSVAEDFAGGPVSPGGQTTFSIRYDALDAIAATGRISFITNVTGSSPFAFVANAAAVHLELEKDASARTVAPGQAITYTIVVTATGGAPIHNWVVSDTLSAGLHLIQPVTVFPPSTSATLAQVEADLPTLAHGLVITPSATFTLTVPLQIELDFTNRRTVTNTAAISSTEVLVPVIDQAAVELTWIDLDLPFVRR